MSCAVLAGCGESGTADRIDAIYAIEMLQGQGRATTVGPLSLPDLLPNAQYMAGGEVRTATDSVLIGRPVRITPQRAARWDAAANEDGEIQVDFTSPLAQSRLWTVEVEVEEVLAGQRPSQALPGVRDDTIQVPFVGPGGVLDVPRFERGVMALGRTAWFLRAALRSEGAHSDEFRIAWDGTAVAQVGEDGSLAFPLVADEMRPASESFTVQQVRELGARPPHRVEVVDGER
jgi:hypothetical protein